jgi:hypothetical protein
VASGATLWLTGNYKLNSATGANPGVLQIGTGATFSHDNNNSATVSYRGIGGTSTDWNNLKIGTAGDTCTTTSSYGYSCSGGTYQGVNVAGGVYPVLFSENGGYDNITYQIYGAAIKYCGTATVPCLDIGSYNQANGYGNAGIIDVENSVFDHTSLLGNVGPYSGYAVNRLTWTNNRENSDLAGFMEIDATRFMSFLGSCSFSGNYFASHVSYNTDDIFGGCSFSGNVFSMGADLGGSTTNPWSKFEGNVWILPGDNAGSNERAYVPFVNNFFYQEGTPGSAHMGGFMGAHDYAMVGNIGARGGSPTESHCGATYTDSAYRSVIIDNLSVMGPGGDPGCQWWASLSMGSAMAAPRSYIDHNGVNGAGVEGWLGFVGHGGNYYPTSAAIGSIRSNIGWAPSAGATNYYVFDFGISINAPTPTTLVDASTVVDWNNAFNGTASSMFNGSSPQAGCKPSTFNGTPYQICSNTASPGSHEKTLDPKYIDTTRRLETWAGHMGQASTFAGAKAALWGCADISACIGNLNAWVRRGWQPTNMALKGAAHDGKIIGFKTTTPGAGYSGACSATITPQDAWDLGGCTTLQTASATCTFAGGVPQLTLASGGAHYRSATPALVQFLCDGGACSPSTPAVVTPIIQPSDIGPVPMVIIPSAQ